MKRITFILFLGILGFAAACSAQADAGQQPGTLLFDLKSYTADMKLSKNSQKQLEHAGIQWAVLGNTLLISLVNQKYVNVDTLYLTRFGEQKKLELKPGEYTITCIAHEFTSTSTNADKFLSKNAFFNNDVLKFTVLPGKTTTLEISPSFVSESAWFRLSKLTMYIPLLKARVLEGGAQQNEAVEINRRTNKSVAWDNYKGPLKF
jgi:hypothetical protein